LGIYDLISLSHYGDWFNARNGKFFDLGDKRKLIKFHENRIKKIPQIQFSLNALVGLFSYPGSFASSIRSLGMNFVDKSSLIKKRLIQQAQTIY